MKILRISLVLFFFCVFVSCDKEPDTTPDDAYLASFEEYEKKKADGRIKYLELCGLFKFDSDVSTIGSGPMNSFQIPVEGMPDQFGVFEIQDSVHVFTANQDVQIKDAEDSLINSIPLSLDEAGNSVQLFLDRLKWQIITRSGAQYLRVWDKQNPMVERFQGYEIFPLNTDYIKQAEFRYFNGEQQQEVDSQLGLPTTTNFVGQLKFDHNGEIYTLDVGRSGFTMVRDQTSGDETYGGGRYVYIDLPDGDGPVTLDFNKLYNPPCSFSQFTTCLYPPTQNTLDFKLEAGEKLKRKVL